ncbi:MAG: NAD(P)-binding domain-containing protein [Pseudomonadota bacterium]
MERTLSPFQQPSPRRPYPMRRQARTVDVIVIGAGHAGLAMSARLTARQVEHVVLEAGDIGQRWRQERWDSLRLLTPNWTMTLPGQPYSGVNPDGFMHKDALADYLAAYARGQRSPVKRDSRVHSVRAVNDRYLVTTTQGEWYCRGLVIATGAYANAVLPRVAEAVPAGVTQLTARDYRNTSDLPRGKVLVVGGSATGLQLAQELRASGREVVLSVGEHVRMPRTVAGRDIYWWLSEAGVLYEAASDVDDLVRARRLPSPQLVGQPGPDLNLGRLAAEGVEIVGRFAGISDGKAQFSGNLPHLCKSADLKLKRLLDRFAEAVPGVLRNDELNVEPTMFGRPRLAIKLGDEIKSVLWATGYAPDYSWLDVDVLDRKGRLRHDGGVVAAPGIYALGLPLMRSRASTFIAGTAADTEAIAEHLFGYLETCAQPLAAST